MKETTPEGRLAAFKILKGRADVPDANGIPARESWSALHETRKTCHRAMDAILTIAEENGQTDLNEEQTEAFTYCEAIASNVNAEMDKRTEAGSKEPLKGARHAPLANGRQRPTEDVSGWRDGQGNVVTLLSASDQMYDRLPGAYRSRPAPRNALAAIVTSMATGADIQAMAGASESLVEGSDGQGGYWVSPTVAAQMIDNARATSVAFRAGARTLPMTGPSMRLVKIDDDPEIGWRGEGQEAKETKPPFGALTLNARKMYSCIEVSSELMEDATNLQVELDRLLSEAIAGELDRAILAGSGKDGEPTGVMAWPGVQVDDGSSWDWDAILDGMEKLELQNHTAGSIIQPPATSRCLRGLKDLQGRYLTPPTDVADLPRYTTTRLAGDTAIVGDMREVIVGVLSNLAIMVDASTGRKRDTLLVTARWRGDVGIARPNGLVRYTDLSLNGGE